MEGKLGEVSLPEVSGLSAGGSRTGPWAFQRVAASCWARHPSRPWAAPTGWWACFLSSANLVESGVELTHPGQPRAGRKAQIKNIYIYIYMYDINKQTTEKKKTHFKKKTKNTKNYLETIGKHAKQRKHPLPSRELGAGLERSGIVPSAKVGEVNWRQRCSVPAPAI